MVVPYKHLNNNHLNIRSGRYSIILGAINDRQQDSFNPGLSGLVLDNNGGPWGQAYDL